MRLEFDLNVGALYVRLTDQPVTSTREAGGNASVDLDAGGAVVGIEVISITERWPVGDILAAYAIGPAERRQIEAYFGLASPASAPLLREVPTLEAELTAPLTLTAPVAA